MTLIPKSNHTPTVRDFRPIACCKVVYKVISKIIASRLAPVLGSLIDNAQAAFVEGRNMTENIHLAQELFRQYNRKMISPRCIIKVDLKKAYDSIDWGFLYAVLVGLRFPSTFIKGVIECVSTTSLSCSINGSLHGFIQGKKGIRQGDPLSPYLFVLCMEYLSRSLKIAIANAKFNYHPKCGRFKITHLAFADNLMLMSRGDSISVRILMECLQKFKDMSGLKVNILKSNLYTSGVLGQDLEDIQALTSFEMGYYSFLIPGGSIGSGKA